MVGIAAIVRNGRLDILYANALGSGAVLGAVSRSARPEPRPVRVPRSPLAPVLGRLGAGRRATCVALLHAEAGRNPYDKALTDLVGELSTRSPEFRVRWAAHNVKNHRSGIKRLHHPLVGDLTLSFEALDLPADGGLARDDLRGRARVRLGSAAARARAVGRAGAEELVAVADGDASSARGLGDRLVAVPAEAQGAVDRGGAVHRRPRGHGLEQGGRPRPDRETVVGAADAGTQLREPARGRRACRRWSGRWSGRRRSSRRCTRRWSPRATRRAFEPCRVPIRSRASDKRTREPGGCDLWPHHRAAGRFRQTAGRSQGSRGRRERGHVRERQVGLGRGRRRRAGARAGRGGGRSRRCSGRAPSPGRGRGRGSGRRGGCARAAARGARTAPRSCADPACSHRTAARSRSSRSRRRAGGSRPRTGRRRSSSARRGGIAS